MNSNLFAPSNDLAEILEELKKAAETGHYFEICGDDAKILLNAFVFSAVHNGNLAAALAHRTCSYAEHDPETGKTVGNCIVCQVSWPCETARAFLRKPQNG